MTNIKENVQRARHALGKGAETVFTSLFCSAVIIFPGKSRVEPPEVLHDADSNRRPIPLDGVVYYPHGITAQTSVDGVLAVVKDFSKGGRDHDGRGEIKLCGKPIPLKPDVSVPIGTNGARGMYTKKQPDEITQADLAKLKDSQLRR